MLHRRQVVVVVPAFQEEDHIEGVIARMPEFVDGIVVVDDGCTDRTGEKARGAGEEAARPVRLLRHEARRGVGAAISTGYRLGLHLTSAPTDAIAVMAGDGQMHPNDLERVVTPIVTGVADYVKGSRFAEPGVRRAMGFPRWVGGHAFSRLTSLAIGQPVTDSQCGFTAVSRQMADRLDLDGLWPSFGYPNDLLGQLAARAARIAQVPVRPVYGNEVSKLRLRHLPPIFYLIGRAALRCRTRATVVVQKAYGSTPTSDRGPVSKAEGVTRTDDAKRRAQLPAEPYDST